MEQQKTRARKTAMVFLSVIAGAFLACFLPICLEHLKNSLITVGCMVSVAIIIAAVEEVGK